LWVFHSRVPWPSQACRRDHDELLCSLVPYKKLLTPPMMTLRTLLLCLVISAQPLPVQAWSEGGHHLIALMAFELLDKDQQQKLVEVLAKHPRFTDDFAPPTDLKNEKEEDRWRIGRAGYWPDVARRQSLYHRASWHYELGSALTIGNVSGVPSRPGLLPEVASLQTQELHISQAIVLCRNVFREQINSPQDRAIAFCWLSHLVADAHQPCHAGSLYLEGVFEDSDGDRGANRILTKQRGNLHALWDQLLGDKHSVNGTRRRMLEIFSDQALMELGLNALSKPDGMDPQLWLSESRTLAVESVYTSEVLNPFEAVYRGVVEKPETISLSEDYLKNAGRIAQRRAIEAAHRLASEWRKAK